AATIWLSGIGGTRACRCSQRGTRSLPAMSSLNAERRSRAWLVRMTSSMVDAASASPAVAASARRPRIVALAAHVASIERTRPRLGWSRGFKHTAFDPWGVLLQTQTRSRPWGLLVVVVAIAGLCAWLAFGHRTRPITAPTLSVPVSAATARRSDLPLVIEAIGSAQAWQAEVIHAQVSGRLLRVAVREGTQVNVGDLVAQIDPAPFQAALMQAQGTLEHDQAQLDLAQVDLKRYQLL